MTTCLEGKGKGLDTRVTTCLEGKGKGLDTRVTTCLEGKGLDTCYSATYMSQTRDQQSFTISEGSGS